MKILFSADWHLGYTLGGANPVKRLDDQVRQIEKIASYLEEYDADVLAIAGDVFEAQERGAARAAVGAMMAALALPLARGLRIVAVAGNHDRDWFMDQANLWLGTQRPADGERIILRTRPELVTIESRGECVNFALLPYPLPARYDMSANDAGGVGQKNETLAKLFVEKMEELRKQASAQRLPTVLLTHITVAGSDVHAHRVTPREDVLVARGNFPEFELTVVGHIHKAEQLGGAHFYYVGGLDRMDIGERAYEPRVLLADIGPDGVRSVVPLPLDPTPFAAITATDEDSLQAARDALPRADETLVKLTLEVAEGTYTAPLVDLARKLFPRLYGNVEHVWTGVEALPPPPEGIDTTNVEATVRWYLEKEQMPDDERDALMELVGELRRAAIASEA